MFMLHLDHLYTSYFLIAGIPIVYRIEYSMDGYVQQGKWKRPVSTQLPASLRPQ